MDELKQTLRMTVLEILKSDREDGYNALLYLKEQNKLHYTVTIGTGQTMTMRTELLKAVIDAQQKATEEHIRRIEEAGVE